MYELEYLQTYKVTVRTKSPLFVGSGSKYAKVDYIFDRVSFSPLDLEKLFIFLINKEHIDDYETFVWNNCTDMRKFLTDDKLAGKERPWRLPDKELSKLFLYSIDPADALDEKHSLKEVHKFIRDSQERAYLPGSSLKGALRTALLYWFIKEQNSHGEFRDSKMESRYLGNIDSSLMRGLRVSDSAPIGNDRFILAAKFDVKTDGTSRKLNLVRECVRPGTEIKLNITLDSSILRKKITKETLENAIAAFAEYYKTTFVSKFTTPRGAARLDYSDCLVLGGGAGYFSKTVAYPYCGYGKALDKVSDLMCRTFRKGGHQNDSSLGISPHTLKYTKYNDEYYPFGLCEVTLD